MTSFISKMINKLSGDTNVVKGVAFDKFDPKQTTLGISKASGGIVYFNVIGKRINPDVNSLSALTPLVEHLGQIRVLTTDCEEVFTEATPGPQIPWKGLTLQEFKLPNGKVAYTLPKEQWNA